MNPLLSAPHRRDVLIGEPGNEWLIRLFAFEVDDKITEVRVCICPVVGRDDDGGAGRRIFAKPPDPRQPPGDARVRMTWDPNEAAVFAEMSLRHDGITSLNINAAVDSKAMLWGLLAAVEQGRREAATEMGAAYMDRFEYGREKKRG